MRNEPWLLPITNCNVPDSKIHAVMPRASPGQPRRVVIVDGFGKTGSDEWQLVGVEPSGGVADKLLPLVSWPATMALDALVKPLLWEQVTHPTILIAQTVHIGDDDVEPAERHSVWWTRAQASQ